MSGASQLVYGYSQPHPGELRPWTLEPLGALIIARSVVTRSESNSILNSLRDGADLIDGALKIHGVKRVARSPILRPPRLDSNAFDAAFTHRLCVVHGLWNLDKVEVISAIVQGANTEVERADRIDSVTDSIAERVGRDFTARSGAVVGNFEHYEIAPRCYRLRTVADDNELDGVDIEIDASATEDAWLNVAVTLQNARVVIQSSIQRWDRSKPTTLSFRSPEPYSWAEVMVYASCGTLVDQGLHGLLSFVEIGMSMITDRKTIHDEWHRHVQQKAGRRNAAKAAKASEVDIVGHPHKSMIGEIGSREPWQPLAELPELHSQKSNAYFLRRDTADG
jgi:hypothetical protein